MLKSHRRATGLAGAHPRWPSTLTSTWNPDYALVVSFAYLRLGWALGLAQSLLSLVFRIESQAQLHKWCSVKLDGRCRDLVSMRPRLKACELGVLNRMEIQGLALELVRGPASLAFWKGPCSGRSLQGPCKPGGAETSPATRRSQGCGSAGGKSFRRFALLLTGYSPATCRVHRAAGAASPAGFGAFALLDSRAHSV